MVEKETRPTPKALTNSQPNTPNTHGEQEEKQEDPSQEVNRPEHKEFLCGPDPLEA